MGRKSKKRLLAEALERAAAAGDARAVEIALEAGARIDPEPGPTSMGALERAASGGHEACVKLLLEAGADPDASPTGWTPLIRAAGAGHEECVRLLLNAGANPRAPGPLRMGTGREAASRGHAGCLRLLLGAGADVDCGATDGQSILGWAAAAGHLECVRLLLAAGAGATMIVDINGPKELLVAAYARATGQGDAAALIEGHFQAHREREELEQSVRAAQARRGGPRA